MIAVRSEMLTIFFGHHFKYENLIFKTKSNGSIFETDFILKIVAKKKVNILGELGR